jgi:hypothetical protein
MKKLSSFCEIVWELYVLLVPRLFDRRAIDWQAWQCPKSLGFSSVAGWGGQYCPLTGFPAGRADRDPGGGDS